MFVEKQQEVHRKVAGKGWHTWCAEIGAEEREGWAAMRRGGGERVLC